LMLVGLLFLQFFLGFTYCGLFPTDLIPRLHRFLSPPPFCPCAPLPLLCSTGMLMAFAL
jgi:hypothetical protein